MKIVIDENICKEKGLDIPTVLAILLVNNTEDISKLFSELEQKEIIMKNIFDHSLYVTERWNNVCSDIILSAKEEMPKEDSLEKLAKEMMSIFPTGKKPGTNNYWKGNVKDTKLKLKKFIYLYGDTYSNEQILKATKDYVESFNGNYLHMRVLKYFIFKEVKKVDSIGNGYIEEISDLATYLENSGQEEVLSRGDWTSKLI